MSHRIGSAALIALGSLVLSASLPAQTSSQSPRPARHELPEYLRSQLGPEDRELFTRLLNMNIESGWAYIPPSEETLRRFEEWRQRKKTP